MTRRPAPRVLFVSHSAEQAGAELTALPLAEALSARFLFLADGPLVGLCRSKGVPVDVERAAREVLGVRTGSGAFASLASAPGAARMVRRLVQRYRGADLIVPVSQKAMALSALACPLARRPMIWMLNDILTADHFSPAMRRVAVWLANLAATRVVVNSAATAEAFVASGGRASLTRLLHVGVNEAPFAKAEALTRAQLGLPGDAFVLGLFGRVAPWKGQAVLIDALAQLPGRVHALVVGAPLFGAAAHAAELERRAAEAGVGDRVHFLGHRTDVPALMKSCDVVVHTSVQPEPFGRVIVEGMLAGRPVVATAAGGVPEIVRDGRDGILTPPGDVDALACVVGRLIDDPEGSGRMARAGRECALAAFTESGMAERFRRILAEIDLGRFPTDQTLEAAS